MMRRLILATAVGAALCTTGLQPAKAWGGGAFGFGAAAGLATGVVVGTAIAHPFYPYPYGYPFYGYPYYPAPVVYPAPVAPAPYPYPYAPPAGYVPSGYAPPAPPSAPAARPAPACGPGQFFNTYTGSCDRR